MQLPSLYAALWTPATLPYPNVYRQLFDLGTCLSTPFPCCGLESLARYKYETILGLILFFLCLLGIMVFCLWCPKCWKPLFQIFFLLCLFFSGGFVDPIPYTLSRLGMEVWKIFFFKTNFLFNLTRGLLILLVFSNNPHLSFWNLLMVYLFIHNMLFIYLCY